MNKFEIHVLLAGFSSDQTEQLLAMLAPLPINLHNCKLDTPAEDLPKVHVLLIGMDELASLPEQVVEDDLDFDISNMDTVPNKQASNADQTEQVIDKGEVLSDFVKDVKATSPYSFAYLMAPSENILSLTSAQKEQYRDFIIYPVNDVFLQKRLDRIVNDLQEKFVQLLKKRRLKKRLEDSDLESHQLKVTLQQSLQSTEQANKHLIRMLSNQVFARMGQRASGRNQQLNLLLVEIAKASGLGEPETKDLTDAWHLRNVGKMGFSDQVLHTAYIKLTVAEQRVFNCHPTLSHAALMIVRPLDKAAKIILQHKEYLDGSGYPNGLEAKDISVPAQILTVVNDYTELVAGRYSDRALSTVEALAYLDNYATEKYNDEIVNSLIKILPALSKKGQGMHDLLVRSIDLKIGMQLTRDLISEEGILLLGEGLTIDRATISRLQEMEMNLQEQFQIFIKQK
ncbi:MAG: hypothetical protein OFPII_00350 [Osedax symbiont Rs1]|nr:MAG: hypothetical protein OFPII_00350 [Osedax symbiont Rs1]